MLDAIRQIVREEVARPASPWLDTDAAAAYLGSTAGTLKNWRACGKGPRYRVLQDRLVRYHRDELDAFVNS
nr:helix-turn-helix domain-containing protein [Sandaracinobacteroides sayramensis]